MFSKPNQLSGRVFDLGGPRQGGRRGQRVHRREGQSRLPEQLQQKQAEAAILLGSQGGYLPGLENEVITK